MKKNFQNLTRLMLASVALAGICSFSANAADAGKKCVYLVGNTGWWNPPVTVYEDTFTPVYETVPGSNIFQGTAYFTDNQWFRFFSGLEEGDDYISDAWERHYIGPATNDENFPEIGKSGVYFTNNVANEEVLSPNAAYTSWHMPISGNIVLTLDLNDNTLTAVSADYPIVCINNTTKPTFSTLANFNSAMNGTQYVPAGKAEIYLYDFAMDTWLSPKGSAVLDDNSLTVLRRNDDLTASSTPKALQFNNWQGGIVNLSAFDGRINISAEKDLYDLSHDSSSMYAVTAGTSVVPWEGAPDGPFYRVSELKYVANGPDSYWEGTVNMPQYGFRLNIISELDRSPEFNRYFVPDGTNTDKELNFVNGYAFSDSYPTTADNANIYWTCNSFKGGDVIVRVSERDGKVSFNDSGAAFGEIYVIGSDQGWNIDKGDMPLKLTDKGGYYGAHYISPDAFFRFYTRLGDWENNSLGTQYYDEPVYVDFNGQENSYDIVNGKGSFGLTSWAGGLLYMYVDVENYTATFSASPIAAAGNILESSDAGPVEKGMFLSDDNKSKIAMRKLSDGVYSSFVSSSYKQPLQIRLFTGNYGVTPEDSEWKTAYSVTLGGELTMDLGETDYKEFDITKINEAIEGNAGSVLNIVNEKYSYRQCEVVVDLNKNKVYIAPMDYLFLMKEGDPEPHANNLATNGLMKVPAPGGIVRIGGEFDYVLYDPTSNNKFSWPAQPDNTLDFSGDLLQNSDDQYNAFTNKRVKINNWVDGYLVVSRNCILDLQHLQTIKVYTSTNGDQIGVAELERISHTNPLFKGTVKYTDYAIDSGYSQMMAFELASKTVTTPDNYYGYYAIYVTPEYLYESYFTTPVKSGSNIIDLSKGKITTTVGPSTSYKNFQLPTVVSSGEVEITLNLEDGEMTIDPKAGSTKAPLELVSDYEGFNTTLYPVSKGTHNHKANFTIDKFATADFYLRTTDYQYLIPAGGKNVDFEPDYNGYVELPFEISASPSAKWHFPGAEEGSEFSILVDLNAKVMKIHSSGHNTGFFIHSYVGYSDIDQGIAIDNFNERGDNWMREERNGIYTGTASVTPGEQNTVFFTKTLTASSSIHHGIVINYSQNHNVDVTGGKTYETYAWDEYIDYDGQNQYYTSYSSLYVVTDKPYIKVDYDSNSHKLTITGTEIDIDAVDEIVADENEAKLTIVPGSGNVTVTAQAETMISFYNLSGIAVKTVTVPAGQSTIDLPSGFYVAGGKKLIVR